MEGADKLNARSALGWLEYCNGTGDTYYAHLRRQNGHEEPYNVRTPFETSNLSPQLP